MSTNNPENATPTFEEAMARLDEIVAGLEDNRLPLAEMVTSYEEGLSLLKHCRRQIEDVRQRVEQINAQNDGGTATLAPFSPPNAAAAPAEPAKPRRRKSASDDEDDSSLF